MFCDWFVSSPDIEEEIALFDAYLAEGHPYAQEQDCESNS